MYLDTVLEYLGLAVTIAAVIMVILRMRRRRNRKIDQAQARQLCEQQCAQNNAALQQAFETAQAAGDEALAAFWQQIMAVEKTNRELVTNAGFMFRPGKIYADMRAEVEAARLRLGDLRAAQELHEELLIGSSLATEAERASRLKALRGLWHYSKYVEEAGLDLKLLTQQLEAALMAWFTPLWDRVLTDADAFRALRGLVADKWLYGKFQQLGAGWLPYAEIGIMLNIDFSKWNQAAAIHLKDPMPGLRDFANLKMKRPNLLMRASRALAGRDLTEAKIVLAFCEDLPQYCSEVGHLRQDLAVMVAQLELDREHAHTS